MNALRLLYVVPMTIFGLGVAAGLLSMLAIPLIRRYALRNLATVQKRLDEIRAQQAELRTKFTPSALHVRLSDDARKRAN